MRILDKAESWKIYRDELEREGQALLSRLPAIVEQAEALGQKLAIEPLPLLYLAGRLGRSNGARVARYRAELELALASIDSLLHELDEPVRRFVARLAGRTPCLIGGGAGYGTVMFGEAKVIESAMIPIDVQHVE